MGSVSSKSKELEPTVLAKTIFKAFFIATGIRSKTMVGRLTTKTSNKIVGKAINIHIDWVPRIHFPIGSRN